MFEPRLNKRVGASQAKLEGVGHGTTPTTNGTTNGK